LIKWSLILNLFLFICLWAAKKVGLKAKICYSFCKFINPQKTRNITLYSFLRKKKLVPIYASFSTVIPRIKRPPYSTFYGGKNNLWSIGRALLCHCEKAFNNYTYKCIKAKVQFTL
jgi:hypothetical protein